MDDLDALLADLETTTSHIAKHPVLLTAPGDGGAEPRPPPPPYSPKHQVTALDLAPPPGGDKEHLYSTVVKPRPPAPSPPPAAVLAPGLGELDRLLQQLSATHGSIADEILAQFPPSHGPDGDKETEPGDGGSPRRSPSSSPPPSKPSATSATLELDKLMASLSDFRVQSNLPGAQQAVVTPAPPPGEGSLDSMLVLLQSDLSRQGVPTGAKGLCASCQLPAGACGQVVTALGSPWHPEHFVCAQCGVALGGCNFFEKDGAPYCERDYFQRFAPRCARCHQPILDKMVTALDQNWHPEHFCCVKCGKPFGEEGFHEKEGRPYCRDDFAELFSARCQACSAAILDSYISALGALWHPHCFVCRECYAPFAQGSFFEHGGRPYCERHYHQRRGSLCGGCGGPIAGRCVTAMARRFHPEHFVCAFCLRPLTKGTFQEHGAKPYCQPCFLKLFG
ncbi:transforming growth factor beta-1-induced transcript 1 protein [Alligator sinensis]|uniref:Transforming growth factor beta-1-induced transcript 1 protein n=1 Tax=Alligator sinensis TaxID=38654 RepID=A0A1U8DNP5_ALLSI|nr:transforming growth factor beta-1-induced transcript 1 protein [Alligator sinensis]